MAEGKNIKFQDSSGNFHNYDFENYQGSLVKEELYKKYWNIFDLFDFDKNGKVETANSLGENELSVFMDKIKEYDIDKNNSIDLLELKNFINQNSKDTSVTPNKFLKLFDEFTTLIDVYMSDKYVRKTNQGEMGDCWLLSQMNMLSNTDWGREAIKNAITDEGDKYTIKFGHVDYVATITKDEVKKAMFPKKYSITDRDAMILEMAVQKFYLSEYEKGNEYFIRRVETIKNNLNNNKSLKDFDVKDNILSGSNVYSQYSLQYLLTGNKVINYYPKEYFFNKDADKKCISDEKEIEKLLLQKAEDNNSSAISFIFNKSKPPMLNGHAYNLTKVERNNSGAIESLIISNPWDSEKEINVPYEDFMNNLFCMMVTFPSPPENDPQVVASEIKTKMDNKTVRLTDFSRTILNMLSENSLNEFLSEIGGLSVIMNYLNDNNLYDDVREDIDFLFDLIKDEDSMFLYLQSQDDSVLEQYCKENNILWDMTSLQ